MDSVTVICGRRIGVDSLSHQLTLFEESKSEQAELEQDAPDKPKPGAVWNGMIWVRDDDVPF